MEAEFKDRAGAFEVWAPLVGPKCGATLARLATWFLFGAVLLLLGVGVMVVAILAEPDNLTVVALGIAFAFLTYACWAVPYVMINNLGVKLRNDLKLSGIDTDRRAPLQNQHFYKAWLVRNGLTAERVISTVEH